MRKAPLKWLVAASLLAVAASAPGQAQMDAPIRVFDTGELSSNRYTVVKRIWTGTLRTVFWLPSHNDAGAAVAALTDKARSVGADGVINLHCLSDGGYYCYGLAIKLKP